MAGVPVRTPFQPRTKAHTILNTTTPSTETIATSNPPLRSNAPAASINRKLSTDADAISDRSTLLFIRRTLCSHLSEKGRTVCIDSNYNKGICAYLVCEDYAGPNVCGGGGKDYCTLHESSGTKAKEGGLGEFAVRRTARLIGYTLYKMSHYPLHPEPISVNPRQVYHSLWPFAPLSPVPLDEDPDTIKSQSNNEAAYRQLIINGVLAVLLPTEDLENDCLTSLVGQIFSEMILGNGIGGKACEPWLLWEGIMKIAEVIQARLPKAKAQVRIDRSNSEITRPNLLDIKAGNTKTSNFGKSMQKYFWLILQYLFLAFAAVRAIFIAIATSSSLPSRIPPRGNLLALRYRVMTRNHR
ncbi:PXA domain-containing protein [Botrytis cinerea]